MDGIIAIIVIVAALSKFVSQTKKVKQNAPGKAAAPMRPAAPVSPARPISSPVMPTVRTPAAPPVSPVENADEFWKKVSSMLEETKAPAGKPAQQKPADAGHGAVSSMREGVSRECEHGSLGGSMAYESHEGGSRVQRAQTAYDRQTETSLYRPAMTAQEMRKAVVMAEILKRPQERMAEQARRWSAR